MARKKADKKDFRVLDKVVTMAEAARIYHIRPASLSYAIDANLIAARRCGKIVLISVDSLDAYFYNRKN